jgi:hypothetical protein
VRVTCQLCGDEVDAVRIPDGQGYATTDFEGFANCSPVRYFHQSKIGLLHHRCTHPTVRDQVDPDREWFFCERPTSVLTRDTLFDRNCDACAAAWVSEGAALWNGA